ncbi:2-dehydropantoate 2-reductase [Chryseobacterium sp.]|uniref:2-dehydropantoate 2-reductase n=1 Tax=Chryseobacterium sp. TaxID=1871047 RepID=UPI00289F2F70|nr:2-dehydropantoate 2-reductase [Chryseobacterium sp.]
MTISIVGTGALGGYYGLMLSKAGHDVHFLLRSDFEKVKKNGLYLKSNVHDDIFLENVNAYKDAAKLPKSDIVIVALKTVQNSSILFDILSKTVDQDSIVVLIQNGLGMEQDLSLKNPNWQIAGGIALITCFKNEMGHIIHQDHGTLDIGNYNVKNVKLLEEFVESLQVGGITSSLQNLNYLRWKKLVWNMAFNGLSVVYNQNTQQIISDVNHLKRCRDIMREVINAAEVCNVILPEDFIDQMIVFTSKMLPYSPSMKQDYDLGRPMEIEYLYKRPIEIAREAGYPMKEALKLYRELTKIQ